MAPMNLAGDIKIVFTGPMGAGKTTAIRGVGDGMGISTEVPLSDGGVGDKTSTTVGLDYGVCRLPGGRVLKLFGTPGQERFRFMWSILGGAAFGLIVLTDNRRSDSIAEVGRYLADFMPRLVMPRAVVGVGWLEAQASPGLDDYCRALQAQGFDVPVIDVDVRRVADVQLLLSVLVGLAEAEHCLPDA